MNAKSDAGPDDDERRRAEAEAILRRVDRDSETFLTSSMARVGRRTADHFAAKEARNETDGAPDPVEIWGRRIGRALSLAGVIVLSYFLGRNLGYW